MPITITGRHMEITDAIRAYIEKKVTRLDKYHDRISEIEVVLDAEAQLKRAEIIVKIDRTDPMIVNHTDEDMYACIDTALDKIERQITRHKEKSRHHKGHVSFSGPEDPYRAMAPAPDEE